MQEMKDTENLSGLKKILGDYDEKILYPVIGLLAIILTSILVDSKGTQKIFDSINQWLIFNFSSGFLIGVTAVLFFALWVGMSKYGDMRLGKDDDRPEFSFIAWVAMMFSAGFGLSTLTWCAAEPLYHLFQSSYTVDAGTAGTPAGIPKAMLLTVFDWGIHGWALFAVGGLAIAFPAYRLGKPMNLGIGLYGILKDKSQTGFWGKLTDVLGVISTLGGNGASLGFGILSIAYGIKHITGVELGSAGTFVAMLMIIAAFTLSAVSGVKRGIRILSLINIYLGLGMLIWLLLTGPTTYLLSLFTQTLGEYISSIVSMSFWSDAGNFADGQYQQRSWLNWWVIFYWLWWVSYIPFCSGFIARISKGRTIREYILGTTLVPVLMTMALFVIWGGNSAYLEVTKAAPMWDNVQQNLGSALYVLLEQFPMGGLLGVLVFFSVVVFGVTTSDSASYFISMQVSKGNPDPKISMRILWGCLLGGAAMLLLATGKLNALKAMAIVAGAPFFFVVIAYMISIVKMLRMAARDEL
ncbi:glycine betaine transporter [Desulforhopalus singaporensis]|uniref:Glycine betaine transporter n=2 Tax=Desulforhopalus singaporensis TaxID=91360 RepID=A0A1H0TC22_9BACT|nr:glycine betaine transporter [Desulforhopalus singaporensis]